MNRQVSVGRRKNNEAGAKMLGVVLWSDNSAKKAIVWCEDHGDLAYIGVSKPNASHTADFAEGDLIRFELTNDGKIRHAINPRRIARHACAPIEGVVDLVGTIDKEATEYKTGSADRQNRMSSELIDLGEVRKRRSQAA
jgi:hypothetical protein